MGWNKDGSTIKAVYIDRPVTGVVLNSRVKYGGSVQYQVKLEVPLYLPWSTELRDTADGGEYQFGPVFNKVTNLWDWQRANLFNVAQGYRLMKEAV